MTARPSLSVIVTTYTTERLRDVRELLDSLARQEFPDMEVIFVGERERELCSLVSAHAEQARLPALRVLFNDGEPGLSQARNLGARHAEGDILAFIDDDAVALPGWARAMADSLTDPSVAAATGPALPLWEDRALSWLPEEFYWFVSCTAFTGWDRPRDVRNAWGMNMSFRRDVFRLCDGFRTDFGIRNGGRSTWHDPPSEDVDLSFRARNLTGKRIVYEPSAKIAHRVSGRRLAWRFVAQRSFSVGYQRRVIQRLYGDWSAAGDLLAPERALAARMARRLPATILRNVPRRPGTAVRQLLLATVSLSFVALGYVSGAFARLDGAPAAHVSGPAGDEVTGSGGT